MLVWQSGGKLGTGCSCILAETVVGADSPVISVLYCTEINLATVVLTG